MKKKKVNYDALYFSTKKPSARILYDSNLIGRWHPKVGGQIVALREVNNGYETKEEAFKAAKGFINHCYRILGKEDRYKNI